MRLHGYCSTCHKIKLVRVSAAAVAMMTLKPIPEGICDACEEASRPAARRSKVS